MKRRSASAWSRPSSLKAMKAYGGENGREGLELAKQHKPDLIIADIMMPELGGQALVSLLRDDPCDPTDSDHHGHGARPAR